MPSDKVRVLVIDDEMQIRRVLTVVLVLALCFGLRLIPLAYAESSSQKKASFDEIDHLPWPSEL